MKSARARIVVSTLLVVSGWVPVACSRPDDPVPSPPTVSASRSTTGYDVEVPDVGYDELVRFVEQVRGAPFRTVPTLQFVPSQQFTRAAGRTAVGSQQALFKALGWSGQLDQDVTTAFGEHSLGRYQRSGGEGEGKIEVPDGPVTEYTRSVIVHELTHAWDDQMFGLRDTGGDRGLAVTAVQEGSAMVTQTAWEQSRPPETQAAINAEKQAKEARWGAVPDAIRSLLVWPYEWGERYLRKRLSDGDTIRTVFGSLPASAEEVMWFRAPDPNRRAPDPQPGDGTVTGNGLFNAASFGLLVGSTPDDQQPVAPWDDGKWVTWRSPSGATCVTVNIATNPETTQDLTGRLTQRGMSDVTVSDTGIVSFSRCA